MKKPKNLDNLFDVHEKQGTLPTRKEVQNVLKNLIKGLKEECPKVRRKGRKLRKADNNIDQIVGAMVGIIAEYGAATVEFVEDEIMPSINKTKKRKPILTEEEFIKQYQDLEVQNWEKKLKTKRYK